MPRNASPGIARPLVTCSLVGTVVAVWPLRERFAPKGTPSLVTIISDSLIVASRILRLAVSFYSYYCLTLWIAFLWQIDFDNRLSDDIGNHCLVNVDGTDFLICHNGRKFYSYKFNHSGLRYEVATCICTGDLVWISGPGEPGMYNDIALFRNSGIMYLLDEGKRVEANDGYRGEAPVHVRCPCVCGTAIEEFEWMEAIC